ncbi:MAG: LysM peptidoglycan-binding domain-containing protein [Deltaproteobacteria bacterium]|nr:LysM peptidoglycan-binding domain-containing protein [Deltaproteobacteria bacterium]
MKRYLATTVVILALLLCAAAAPAQEAGETRSYVVQRGDTLGGIAKKFYGKSSLGARLWRANKNLVAHPNKLTPGDTIYLFPETTLSLNQAIEVPPPADLTDNPNFPDEREAPTKLYTSNNLLDTSFPEYFSFVADIATGSRSPSTKIKIKRIVAPHKKEDKPKYIDDYYEVRIVGEIIASSERGATIHDDGESMTGAGRLLLSTNDNVIVRFTDDLAKILDSDSYEDHDPYFRTFPIYGIDAPVQEPDRGRADHGDTVGRLMRYKGSLTVVARVESTAPAKGAASRVAKRRDVANQDLEPVTYVAKVIKASDIIELGDRIMIFVPLDPGPERRLDPPYVEEAGSHVPAGK